MKIEGKIAIITGGASGLGEALARRLVSKGGKVVLGDLSDEKGQQVARELNQKSPNSAFYRNCNVTSKSDLEGLFQLAREKFGRIDIVVNNAGIGEKTLFTENHEDDWKPVVEIDLNAVIVGTRLAIVEFQKQKSPGVILNTASMAGLVITPFQPVYAAAKAGVVNFSNSLGYLSKTDDIRVVPICPLFTKTAMTDEAVARGVEIKQWVSLDMVIDAFVLAIEDESIAGEPIRITPKYGIDLPARRIKSKI